MILSRLLFSSLWFLVSLTSASKTFSDGQPDEVEMVELSGQILLDAMTEAINDPLQEGKIPELTFSNPSSLPESILVPMSVACKLFEDFVNGKTLDAETDRMIPFLPPTITFLFIAEIMLHPERIQERLILYGSILEKLPVLQSENGFLSLDKYDATMKQALIWSFEYAVQTKEKAVRWLIRAYIVELMNISTTDNLNEHQLFLLQKHVPSLTESPILLPLFLRFKEIVQSKRMAFVKEARIAARRLVSKFFFSIDDIKDARDFFAYRGLTQHSIKIVEIIYAQVVSGDMKVSLDPCIQCIALLRQIRDTFRCEDNYEIASIALTKMPMQLDLDIKDLSLMKCFERQFFILNRKLNKWQTLLKLVEEIPLEIILGNIKPGLSFKVAEQRLTQTMIDFRLSIHLAHEAIRQYAHLVNEFKVLNQTNETRLTNTEMRLKILWEYVGAEKGYIPSKDIKSIAIGLYFDSFINRASQTFETICGPILDYFSWRQTRTAISSAWNSDHKPTDLSKLVVANGDDDGKHVISSNDHGNSLTEYKDMVPPKISKNLGMNIFYMAITLIFQMMYRSIFGGINF